MGNRVTLRATQVTDLRSGDIDLGFIINDDYAEVTGIMDVVPDDDRELLIKAIQECGSTTLDELLDTAKERGMRCGASYFSAEEVRGIVDEATLSNEKKKK